MADFKVTELDASLDFDNLAYWDVVIIGAGPGGLAASLTTAHRGLTTLVIEAKATARCAMVDHRNVVAFGLLVERPIVLVAHGLAVDRDTR